LSISDLLGLAYLIEEGIQSTLFTGELLDLSTASNTTTELEPILNFYQSPELHKNQIKFTKESLSHQLHAGTTLSSKVSSLSSNPFILLKPDDIMDMSTKDPKASSSVLRPNASIMVTPTPKSYSINDTSVTTLSNLILEQLNQDKENSQIPTEPNTPQTESFPEVHSELRQRYRFNIIRHRGSVSNTNTLHLFKSFATALRSSDPSLLILPYSASKQHYTPLATLKQIQTMESNQMHQYFKSFTIVNCIPLADFST
jgi:ribosomal protein S16